MTHASVFSGIGGPEVAATMLGWRNLFHCEINPFGRQVLDYWYPNSESYEDITQTDFTKWRGRVDVLTGGFPCQPFSYAGRRRGAEDDRYLWPHMHRCINEIQPTWFIGENVAGITTMVEQGTVSKVAGTASLFEAFDDIRRRYELRETFTMQRICDDLESDGYSVQPILIPACAVGAPHRRDRVFIVARRVEAVSEDAMHGGQLHRPNKEQGSERNERHTCAGGGERICGETSRTTSADSACGREGTPRPSDCVEGGRGDTNQQQSEWGAASEWNNRFYAILRHATDTSREGLERQDESGCGQGGQRLHLWRDSARRGCETIPHPDSHRGSEVDEHMEPQLADGAKPFSNGGQRNASDTESRRAGRLRIESEEEGSRMRDVIFGNGCRLCISTDEAGLGRYANFPSVSPVHRGNDGIPFDVDSLTISFGKWRTEALKAYGNAIVPQVMYELFRGIEIVETAGTESR